LCRREWDENGNRIAKKYICEKQLGDTITRKEDVEARVAEAQKTLLTTGAFHTIVIRWNEADFLLA